MTIKEIRTATGLSQAKFASLFDVPVGTLQAWEQGRQKPPKYVVQMMQRILDMERPASKFNPFHDSKFFISYDSDKNGERRMLVELYQDELIQLRAEINAVLQSKDTTAGSRHL